MSGNYLTQDLDARRPSHSLLRLHPRSAPCWASWTPAMCRCSNPSLPGLSQGLQQRQVAAALSMSCLPQSFGKHSRSSLCAT